MIKRISKRIVPMIGAVALLLNLAVAPQRARAVAVTAAVAASAAAILTACGVSYWAATQTDAIDYIAGKIDDYLDSIDETGTSYEDWLEISGTSQLFEVVSGGVMRFTSGVANKLLDFCRWLQQDEDIESGGEAVGDTGGSINFATQMWGAGDGSRGEVRALSNSLIEVSFFLWRSGYGSTPQFGVLIPVSSSNCVVTSQSTIPSTAFTASYRDSLAMLNPNKSISEGMALSLSSGGQSYIQISISATPSPGLESGKSGTAYFSITEQDGLVTDPIAVITPSDFVNIPSAIDSDALFAVKPSVDLASGDSVDDAADAILDGITSEDGLSSEVEDTPGTSWGWLYTLLSNIAATIGAGVSDIKDKLDGIKGSADNAASAAQGAATASQGAASAAQGAASAAQDAATAAQGVQDAVEGMQSTAEGIEDNTATIARNLAPATYGNAADYQLDLTSLFPFCIPRDIYTAIGLLVAEPEAPSIDWDMPLPNGSTYHIEYDLSDWDGIASLLRHLELLLYGVGLMMATKSIIKW